jgi:hypothetical protein
MRNYILAGIAALALGSTGPSLAAPGPVDAPAVRQIADVGAPVTRVGCSFRKWCGPTKCHRRLWCR